MKNAKGKRLNRSLGGDILIFTFLAALGVCMFLPMVYAAGNALKPLDELWVFPPRFFPRNPTFENFEDLFTVMSSATVPFARYLFNTLFIAVVGTVGHVILSSMCAYPLAKHRFRGSRVIFSVIEMSLMFTTAVTAIPSFLIISKLGWIDSHAALIVPAFSGSLGLYLMKQFMETNINDSVLEAARIDGAGELKIFWTIVMPAVKPAWLTLILFSFQNLWSIGGNTYIYGEHLKTLNYAISQIVAGGLARAGTGAAATMVMAVPPVLVFLISQGNVVETMSTSGMKD